MKTADSVSLLLFPAAWAVHSKMSMEKVVTAAADGERNRPDINSPIALSVTINMMSPRAQAAKCPESRLVPVARLAGIRLIKHKIQNRNRTVARYLPRINWVTEMGDENNN